MWSCRRNGRVVMIRKVQKILDSTLHAAKNATAPTAANPVNAVHKVPLETPSTFSTVSTAVTEMTKLPTRRMPIIISAGRL